MSTGRNTETLDRLYLEWAQFTDARTARELAYAAHLRSLASDGTLDHDQARLVQNLLENMGDAPP